MLNTAGACYIILDVIIADSSKCSIFSACRLNQGVMYDAASKREFQKTLHI
jgi:hypothetical protein